MYIILFIIFVLSLSALVIGCLAYIKKPTKPFILPGGGPFGPISEITCTKLGGIPIESGCEFPDTYAKGFKQCTGQTIPNKVIVPWDRNEISKQCHTLFPNNPIDGPEPPPLTAEAALTCCSTTGGDKRLCHSGGCCCNFFGCNCNNCKGTGKGCSPACYACGAPGVPPLWSGTPGDPDDPLRQDPWPTNHDSYGGGGEFGDTMPGACQQPNPDGEADCGLEADCSEHKGCACTPTIDGKKYKCPW